MKENTLSFSEIEKAFHTLQKSFSEFEKVVEEEECPVCFESYSPTFRPVRFNNQVLFYIFFLIVYLIVIYI